MSRAFQVILGLRALLLQLCALLVSGARVQLALLPSEILVQQHQPSILPTPITQ